MIVQTLAHPATPRADTPGIARRLPLHSGKPPSAGRRPLAVAAGEALRGALDRVIARASPIPDDPVLDVRLFPWTHLLRDDWRAIRDEALALRAMPDADEWRSIPLWSDGARVADTAARCPVTSALVARVPGLDRAALSLLAPGAHVSARRGASKALVTCHLGLVIPRDGDARMRVHDRVVRWAEGETLVFDDRYRHEVWNETGGTPIVLTIRFQRPLRRSGKWLARILLLIAHRIAVVGAARKDFGPPNTTVQPLAGAQGRRFAAAATACARSLPS